MRRVAECVLPVVAVVALALVLARLALWVGGYLG